MNTPHPKTKRQMMPAVPGINRAARRQAMRAQGHRGSKAGRQFPNRSAHVGLTAEEITERQEQAIAAQQEHERRNEARRSGLIIPPTPGEIDQLKAEGKIDHDPRLLVP